MTRSAKSILHDRQTRYPVETQQQLRMVPMIDVVFLLLIFFLLSSSFRTQEGFLPAELPRRILHSAGSEVEPLVLHVFSNPDQSCQIQIGKEFSLKIPVHPDGTMNFLPLCSSIQTILAAHGRSLEDPIKLQPTRHTRWDHVVKTYNALWQLNAQNIIFAIAE